MLDNETVVTPVDAEKQVLDGQQTEDQQSSNPNQTVVNTPVDEAKKDNVGEAIKLEVDRRLAKETTRIAQEARDTLIASENIVYNGKQITNESDYREMIKEQEIREQYKGKVDGEILNELVEGKKFREQYLNKQQKDEAKAKQDADFKDFIDTFPDATVDKIPQAVWDDVAKGKSLVDAYTRHENQLLKDKLAAVNKGKDIEEKNNENAASSTGSVSNKGDNAQLTHYTKEQVEAMSDKDLDKNWDAVMASQQKWYK